MILISANKFGKIKYFSTLLGLIFIEITRGPLVFSESLDQDLYGNAQILFLKLCRFV